MSTDPMYLQGMDDVDVQTLASLMRLMDKGIVEAVTTEQIVTGTMTYSAGVKLEPSDVETIARALGKNGLASVKFTETKYDQR